MVKTILQDLIDSKRKKKKRKTEKEVRREHQGQNGEPVRAVEDRGMCIRIVETS